MYNMCISVQACMGSVSEDNDTEICKWMEILYVVMGPIFVAAHQPEQAVLQPFVFFLNMKGSVQNKLLVFWLKLDLRLCVDNRRFRTTSVTSATSISCHFINKSKLDCYVLRYEWTITPHHRPRLHQFYKLHKPVSSWVLCVSIKGGSSGRVWTGIWRGASSPRVHCLEQGTEPLTA